MKKNILFLLLNLILILNLSCSTTEPPIPPDDKKPTLTLELDDASCTEAWLQLTTKDLTLPAELTLKQYNPTGDSLSLSFLLNTQDSLIYIDSLLPSQTYNFQLSCIPHSGGQNPVSSNKVQAQTLDTTSHNFTFTSWMFGTVGSSVLYDVAIIDENNIWAVGEIMIDDTSQNGYTTYNAVHWDGSEWSLHKLYFYTIPGIPDTGVYEARSILAFDENNIWITSGSQITKWDGVRQTFRHTTPVSINKLWGTDNRNIYAVGYNGQIAHFNGTNWQRIESGTDLNIYDIWGDYKEKINEFEIIAVASKVLVNQEKKIIKINKTDDVTSLSTNGIPSNLTGIWFKNKVFYVVGSGMFRKNDIESTSEWKAFHSGIINYHISDIRGNDYNDIIASGSFGELVHFNGINWKSYTDETYMNGAWGGTIKENIICCVGLKNNKAIVTIGKR